jgi:hypothetical protein
MAPSGRAIRNRARTEGASIQEVVVTALLRAFALPWESPVRRDLSDIVGTWREDPEMDMAFEEQRRVDPKLWQ